MWSFEFEQPERPDVVNPRVDGEEARQPLKEAHKDKDIDKIDAELIEKDDQRQKRITGSVEAFPKSPSWASVEACIEFLHLVRYVPVAFYPKSSQNQS